MFFQEKINIQKNDLVLEIGPGGSPYYRSNILFDRFFEGDEASKQRGETELITQNKPLVISQHMNLPFKDNAFDYLICSHVLEHVDARDIEHFLMENFRVSKKGYIEFPSIFYEFWFNFNVHKNILFYIDKTLYIIEKDNIKIFQKENQQYFEIMVHFLSKSKILSRLILAYKELFFIGFEYEKEVRIKKLNKLSEIDFIKHFKDILKKKLSIFDFIFNSGQHLLKKKLYKNNNNLDIFKLLKCPSCSKENDFIGNKEGTFKCNDCNYNFLIKLK